MTRHAADLILIVHALWVGIVVLAVPAILIGGLLGWRWVRNSWFRNIHLAMIAIVVAEALLGIACPLTVWESALREADGEAGYRTSFIADFLHWLIFYEAPPWVFTLAYTAFGALIAGLYWFVPPDWLARARGLGPAGAPQAKVG
ncbi:MAG TPA: DUF2784 domain-containing protein [Alphaproteobacteria bacterium]|nr:DUF2784 domain-containing protein [Alphaproteobacteria bacterium]